jgi:threonine synthase
MNDITTRGDTSLKRFCDILPEGLAPDGGLYLHPQGSVGLMRCP